MSWMMLTDCMTETEHFIESYSITYVHGLVEKPFNRVDVSIEYADSGVLKKLDLLLTLEDYEALKKWLLRKKQY